MINTVALSAQPGLAELAELYHLGQDGHCLPAANREPQGVVAEDQVVAPACAESAAEAGLNVWHSHGGCQSPLPAGSGGAARA